VKIQISKIKNPFVIIRDRVKVFPLNTDYDAANFNPFVKNFAYNENRGESFDWISYRRRAVELTSESEVSKAERIINDYYAVTLPAQKLEGKSHPLYNAMAKIAAESMRSFKADFFHHDTCALGEIMRMERGEWFLWLVRESGTWFLDWAEVGKGGGVDDIIDYSRKHENHDVYFGTGGGLVKLDSFAELDKIAMIQWKYERII